jgi:hypothetical protein
MLASDRAPTEIWQSILTLAADSPLLPHQGCDIVDAIILFSSGCESQRRKFEAEATRTKLRLVCRSWDAFLSNRAFEMLLSSAYTAVTSCSPRNPPQRFEILEPFDCQCDGACLFSQQLPHLHSMSRGRTLNHTTVDSIWATVPGFESLEVCLVPDDLLSTTILDRMVKLQALALKPTPSRQKELSILLQHDTILTITHLHLNGMFADALDAVPRDMFLPTLSSLSLDFTRSAHAVASARIERTPLNDWRLPALRALRVGGHVEVELASGLHDFIFKSWPNVTSLYLDFTYGLWSGRSEPLTVTSGIWTCFPNLKTFGVGLATLSCASPPPPPSYPRFTLLVDGIWRKDMGEQPDSCRPLVPFIHALHDWNPNEIVFLSSWRQMNKCLEKRRSCGHPFTVLPRGVVSAIMARDIRVVDIDRVPICDDEGMLFLQTLLG